MPRKRSWIAFPVVWMLFLPFRPQPLNREQLHFALAFNKLWWWILMFVATVILLLSCIEIISSSSNLFYLQFDQTHTRWLRWANRLQTCSVSTPAANMVKLYSFNPLWTMITTMFQKKWNMYHISEPIIRRRFFFQNLCHFVHCRAVFTDSFSFAMKRCNTSRGFGAFFVQPCDRFLFPFYFFSHFPVLSCMIVF